MISNLEKFLLKSPISVTVRLMNQLIIEPSAPLNPQDSPCQTYGCRCQDLHKTSMNSMENICANLLQTIINFAK